MKRILKDYPVAAHIVLTLIACALIGASWNAHIDQRYVVLLNKEWTPCFGCEDYAISWILDTSKGDVWRFTIYADRFTRTKLALDKAH